MVQDAEHGKVDVGLPAEAQALDNSTIDPLGVGSHELDLSPKWEDPIQVRLIALWLIGAVLALSGCASFTVTDTKPLTQAELAPPGSFSLSQDGYRLPALPPHAEAPE